VTMTAMAAERLERVPLTAVEVRAVVTVERAGARLVAGEGEVTVVAMEAYILKAIAVEVVTVVQVVVEETVS